MSFNIQDWYWAISGNNTQVYSSKLANYVLLNDPAFLLFLSFGNIPTKISTESDLFDLLSEKFPVGLINTPAAQDKKKSMAISNLDKVTFAILFNHENRIRVLEGKPQITQLQFIAGIKLFINGV